MSEIRKFRIIVNLKEYGTCSGSSPSSVAKKAVKKLCDGSKKIVKFSLKECKRDCKKECGPYQGHMEKLDKPYKRNGKTITHRAVCEKVQIKKMRCGGGAFNYSPNKTDMTESEWNIARYSLYFIIFPKIHIKLSNDDTDYYSVRSYKNSSDKMFYYLCVLPYMPTTKNENKVGLHFPSGYFSYVIHLSEDLVYSIYKISFTERVIMATTKINLDKMSHEELTKLLQIVESQIKLQTNRNNSQQNNVNKNKKLIPKNYESLLQLKQDIELLLQSN